jgi:hypothetical protein
MATDTNTFEGWCIIEQMGHKRMAGYVSEQTIGGHSFIRVDIPKADTPPTVPGAKPNGSSDWYATQFITGQTVYAITPCTEEIARKVAANSQPQPVTEWDLKPRALAAASETDDYDVDEDDA